MNIKNDDYLPTYPKGSLLFFKDECTYQKDICLIKRGNKLVLCSVINSYRLELELLDLYTDERFKTLRENVKGVVTRNICFKE
jgi:hypothetical protein